MGIFGRKRRPRSRQARPDPDLSMLSVDEAARLRSLVAGWFAQRGTEVSIAPGYVQTDQGNKYGLWNLAARCHDDGRGPAAWPGLVDEHLTVLLEAEQTDIEGFTDEEFRDLLRLRLLEDQPDPDDDPGHAPLWAPGVRRHLVLDLPTTVITPSRAELDRRGALGPLTDLAWQQTASIVVTEDLERERVEADGHYAWCVLGDSVFTASLALFLPDVVRRFEPGVGLDQGVIFSIPLRHQLNYRVVEHPMSVLDALLVLPQFTVAGFRDAIGPVSPSVYLWLYGEVTRLSTVDDGQITVRPGPHLEPLLHQIDDPDGPTAR